MRELRLSGVHEDGEHLLLVDEQGERSQLRITEELRGAIRRDRSRALADAGVPEPEQVELRPRDVQAMLRSGLSLEDVAERAGWTVEKVSRYEAPIRAERDHIAGLARAVPVADPTARRGEESTFGQRVERRLDGRGVDADDVTWDSWRGSEQDWTVQCSFPAGGKLRHATWRFGLDGRTLTPVDDEARWLGEDEASPGPLQAAATTRDSRDSSVYDVEAEGGLDAATAPRVRKVRGGATSATAVPAHPAGRATERPDSAGGATASPDAETVDLMAAMRERTKGRRRKGRTRQPGSAQFPADAIPPEQLDTDGPPPPVGSHPRPEEAAAATEAPRDELGHDPVTGTADMFAEIELDDGSPAADDLAVDDRAVDEVAVDGLAVDDIAPDDDRDAAAAQTGDAPEPELTEPKVTEPTETVELPESEPAGEAAETAVPDRPSAARKGRPSVPSWDDIMFGRRPGRD